jgi:hypothetical protein
MKRRIITVMLLALALLTLTASTAAAESPSISGVLVRQGDGYIVNGALPGVGSFHGTLTELTTGFNSCPWGGTTSAFCIFTAPGVPPYNCNLLGGAVTLNFQGTIYEGFVGPDGLGHYQSSLCRDPDQPTIYDLALYIWSTSHVPPGNFPDILGLGGSVQQITPTVFKWSQ